MALELVIPLVFGLLLFSFLLWRMFSFNTMVTVLSIMVAAVLGGFCEHQWRFVNWSIVLFS
jgi:hypothetical protein